MFQMLLNGDTEEIELSSKAEFAESIREGKNAIKILTRDMATSRYVLLLLNSIEGIVELKDRMLISYGYKGDDFDRLPYELQLLDLRLTIEAHSRQELLGNILIQNKEMLWNGNIPFSVYYGITTIDSQILRINPPLAYKKAADNLFSKIPREYGKNISYFWYGGFVYDLPMVVGETFVFIDTRSMSALNYVEMRRKIHFIRQMYNIVSLFKNLLKMEKVPRISILNKEGRIKVLPHDTSFLVSKSSRNQIADYSQFKAGAIVDITETSLDYLELKRQSYNPKKTISDENNEEIRNGLEISFYNIPNIDKIFKKMHKLGSRTFLDAFHSLYELIYYAENHSVLSKEINSIINHISSSTKLSKLETKIFIEQFLQKFGIIVGDYFLSSHVYIIKKFQEMLRNLAKYSSTNRKGKKFESYISELLSDNFFIIIDKNYEIREKYMPDHVSMRLFRRIKQKSEIDIVVKTNRLSMIFFIISDKFDKKMFKRRNFQNHAEDWYYLTQKYVKTIENIIGVPVIATNLAVNTSQFETDYSYVFSVNLLVRELKNLENRLSKKVNDTEKEGIFFPFNNKDNYLSL